MSPTETCARNPLIYGPRTHWVFDPASGYCAWCGERTDDE